MTCWVSLSLEGTEKEGENAMWGHIVSEREQTEENRAGRRAAVQERPVGAKMGPPQGVLPTDGGGTAEAAWGRRRHTGVWGRRWCGVAPGKVPCARARRQLRGEPSGG